VALEPDVRSASPACIRNSGSTIVEEVAEVLLRAARGGRVGDNVKRRRLLMPKFLIEASYTPEGAKGVQSAGGTSRRDAVAQVAESVGGRLESFYFAFGDSDAYVIVDLPDNESAAAVALTVNAGGGATTKTVVLLTPDEVDAAAKRSVDYRPPGA
jgi:uncharacterized protein with GYD domain